MRNAFRTKHFLFTLVAAVSIASSGFTSVVSLAKACPFCSAVSQTLTEQIDSVDAAVVVKLEKLPDPAVVNDPAGELPMATFSLVQALSGKDYFVGDNAKVPIEAIFFGDGKPGDLYLLTGVEPVRWNWSSPIKLTSQGDEYLRKLSDAPKEGADRLAFFLPYLNHADPMLSQDAYEEFARAPYEDVIGLKPKLEPAKLVTWIESQEVSSSGRRLYLTLLGVCGGDEQHALLERLMTTEDRKLRAALDATIACWLTLRGEQGCDLVDRLFIENQEGEYADTYAAVMALRFHGTETEAVPRERILVSFRKMLDRPALADLVIPDLARWQDWSVKPKLVQLFKDADEKSAWVRLPIVNYFRACPDGDAKTILAELEKIDPESVKRSNSLFFFPAGPAKEAPAAKTEGEEASAERPRRLFEGEVVLAKAATEFPVATTAPAPAPTEFVPSRSSAPASPVTTDAAPAIGAVPPTSDMAFQATDLDRRDAPAAPELSWWVVLGGLGIAISFCGLVQWSVLRG